MVFQELCRSLPLEFQNKKLAVGKFMITFIKTVWIPRIAQTLCLPYLYKRTTTLVWKS